ncbi:hypothetical protein DXG01_015627 [Tephrocybe rancida]|nr:hypothetical protein DXG01_015627 [Tephrocybe rancida]
MVMLKAVNRIRTPDEIPVGKLLSSERLASPRNHCIPYLEVIDAPDGSDFSFIVFPLLLDTEHAPLKTIGEAVELFRQIFEGCNYAKAKQGFEFMRELVNDMTNADPQKRPLMSEVVPRLNAIIEGLSDWELRSPVIRAGKRLKWRRRVAHWTVQLIRKARGIPAIPRA